MKKFHLLLTVLFTGMLACQTPATPVTPKGSAAKPDLRSLHLSFANPKDPSCGMPLTAGLEDTVRYKGKLYGFCSKECKDAFLKDPETSLSALK